MLRESYERQFWAAMAGLTGSGLLFHLMVPVPWDPRYLVLALVGMAALAGGGVQVVLDRLSVASARLQRAAYPAVIAAAVLLMAVAVAKVKAKSNPGYRKMVAGCVLCGHEGDADWGLPGAMEGDLIVEASLSDPDRHLTVLRTSKVLASMGWSGNGYQLRYPLSLRGIGLSRSGARLTCCHSRQMHPARRAPTALSSGGAAERLGGRHRGVELRRV